MHAKQSNVFCHPHVYSNDYVQQTTMKVKKKKIKKKRQKFKAG
jgi:hypothetical protein